MTKLVKVSSIVALSVLLCACGHKTQANAALSPETINLLKESRASMIHVPGGTFTMGEIKYEGQTYSFYPHPVTLSSFYMSKDNVSYGEYDAYTKETGQPTIDAGLLKYHYFARGPHYPVGVTWYQAHDYCAWLAKNTGLPYALPTEAQWEYAARDGGKPNWMFPTNDGKAEPGINFPSDQQVSSQPGTVPGSEEALPVGSIPCTPMGICGLTGAVNEWVNDWEAANFSDQPVTNPQGPATGTQKLLRGGGPGYNDGYNNNIGRSGEDPNADAAGFHCVINSSEPSNQLGAFAPGYPK